MTQRFLLRTACPLLFQHLKVVELHADFDGWVPHPMLRSVFEDMKDLETLTVHDTGSGQARDFFTIAKMVMELDGNIHDPAPSTATALPGLQELHLQNVTLGAGHADAGGEECVDIREHVQDFVRMRRELAMELRAEYLTYKISIALRPPEVWPEEEAIDSDFQRWC